jgi:hypothetical protein
MRKLHLCLRRDTGATFSGKPNDAECLIFAIITYQVPIESFCALDDAFFPYGLFSWHGLSNRPHFSVLKSGLQNLWMTISARTVVLEITAKATLKFDLIKGRPLAWPRIESPDELMTVGSARPMEDAARIAYTELIVWMEELGWDRWDAYQALTQIGNLYVGNMVDTTYSLVAKIAKKYALLQIKD